MDSCVCAALAARDHEGAAALHVSYGQRTEERERRAFSAICDRLHIRDRLVVRNEALRAIGGSALTDPEIAVPDSHEIGREIPVTPLIAMRKAQIVRLGLELGAPFDLTWSCYSREDAACGVCDSCVLRLRAFEQAGAADPIPYVETANRI